MRGHTMDGFILMASAKLSSVFILVTVAPDGECQASRVRSLLQGRVPLEAVQSVVDTCGSVISFDDPAVAADVYNRLSDAVKTSDLDASISMISHGHVLAESYSRLATPTVPPFSSPRAEIRQ